MVLSSGVQYVYSLVHSENQMKQILFLGLFEF